MKIVLDTNVFMSGIFWSGPPSDVLDLWQQGKITLCITPDILEEYISVGKRLTKKYPGIDVSPFIELVTIYGHMVPDIKLAETISRDPDDDKFIACAVSAKAKVIVSGDKDLLDLIKHKQIDILTPKSFILGL